MDASMTIELDWKLQNFLQTFFIFYFHFFECEQLLGTGYLYFKVRDICDRILKVSTNIECNVLKSFDFVE